MTERSEQLLRSRLLSLAGSPGVIEGSLPDLLSLRFATDGEGLSPDVQDRHLEELHYRLNSRSNIALPEWWRAPLRRRLVWSTLAVGAAVVILLLFAFLLRPKGNPRNLVKNPPSPKRDIRMEVPRQPREKVPPKEEHFVKDTPRRSDKLPPKAKSPGERRVVKDIPGSGGKHAPAPPKMMAKLPVGKFVDVIGEPTYRLPGEKKDNKVLRKQEPVYAQATVQTGDMDKTVIQFSDGTTVTLDFNTTVVLPAAASKTPRPEEISVLSGRVTVHVVHLEGGKDVAAIDTASRKPVQVAGAPNALPFAVKTPVATAKVVGTTFSLALVQEKQLTAVLQVTEGRVEFSNEHGAVLAGEKTESKATKGSKPTEPKRVTILGAFRVWNNLANIGFTSSSARLTTADAKQLYAYPYGTLGIGTQESGDHRIHVTSVTTEGPAAKAGIERNDIVAAINGNPIRNGTEYFLAMAERPGKKINLTIVREGRSIDFPLVTTSNRDTLRYPASLPKCAAEQHSAATWLAVSGQTDVALARLISISKRNPIAATYNNIGVIFETRDKMGKAIRNYQAAIRLEPGNYLYHFNLGRALRNIGNFDRAVQEYQRSAEIEPNSGGIWAQAQVLGFLNRPDRELEVLQSQLERWKSFGTYWGLTSSALKRLGRIDEAIEAAKKFVELDPFNEWAHRELGSDYSLKAKLQEAEAEYRKAVELEPGNSYTHISLGLILLKERRYLEAEQELLKAVRMDPTARLPHSDLGVLYTRMGRLAEAERETRRAIELNPADAPSEEVRDDLIRLADIYIGQDRLDEACRLLYRAASINPTYPLPYSYLANIIAKATPNKADEVYRKTVSIMPNDTNTLNQFAYSLADHGVMLERALQLAERGIMLRPNDPDNLDTIGWIHFKLGQYAEAEPFLLRSNEIFREQHSPIAANSYAEHLGPLYEKLNQPDKAKEAYRKALTINPKNKEAAEALKRLGGQ